MAGVDILASVMTGATAAFLAELPPLHKGKAEPVYLYPDPAQHLSADSDTRPKERFLKWYREHKPEAIVTSSAPIAYWLMEEGYRLPQDVAVVSATLQEGEPLTSGIVEASREIGAAAADFLVGSLQRGEYGIPATPQRILLEGKWLDVKTTGKKINRPSRK